MICKTCVKNVRANNIRPKYKNLIEWLSDPNNVYIGRGNIIEIDGKKYPQESSIWANPFKPKEHIGKDVLQLYSEYIINKIEKENLVNELLSLKGKNLGCWCINTDNYDNIVCHGQILLMLIDHYSL